mmetsp:Transcript_10144/g.15476  ORF Transcript_10144/g.15476 Transcript_10144/m.15476 type:complete len:89 (+) Transcript_10144:882-1148(+)
MLLNKQKTRNQHRVMSPAWRSIKNSIFRWMPLAVSASQNVSVITSSARLNAKRHPIRNDVVEIVRDICFSLLGNHQAAILGGMLNKNA